MELLSSKLAHALGGLTFFCPGCDSVHVIYTDHYNRGPGPRWKWDGDLIRPTFSPSILVSYSGTKHCHSFIRDGEIQYLGDCHHELASKTVPLPDLPDWFIEGHYVKP